MDRNEDKPSVPQVGVGIDTAEVEAAKKKKRLFPSTSHHRVGRHGRRLLLGLVEEEVEEEQTMATGCF